MINTLKTWAVAHPEIASAIHTFLATFLSTFFILLSQIPQSALLSPTTWTFSAIAGLIVTAVRAAIKTVSPIAM